MNVTLVQFRIYPSELLSSWGSRVKLHSWIFVLQELRRSHGCNTWKERNTNIRGDYKTGKNECYLGGCEMVKGSSCRINCTLLLDESTVWALRSMKSLHYAGIIRRDVGQDLCMSKTFPRVAVVSFWRGGRKVLKSARTWWFLALMVCLRKKMKDFRFVKAFYFKCSSAIAELEISGPTLTLLVQARNSPSEVL